MGVPSCASERSADGGEGLDWYPPSVINQVGIFFLQPTENANGRFKKVGTRKAATRLCRAWKRSKKPLFLRFRCNQRKP
jgi:hypothetical protein